MPKVRFFAKECPLKESCSAHSWKKARACGDTEQECREAVIRHLMRSGHHELSFSDAVNMGNLRIIETYEEEDEPDAPAPKRMPIDNSNIALAATPAPKRAPPLRPDAANLMLSRSSSAGIVPAISSGYIYMRVREFQAAIDCVSRACSSASQAQRLALAAGRAFADEVSALNEVKANLEAIKATAEMAQQQQEQQEQQEQQQQQQQQRG